MHDILQDLILGELVMRIEEVLANHLVSSNNFHVYILHHRTSGARISFLQIADSSGSSKYQEVHSDAVTYEDNQYDSPKSWIDAVHTLLKRTQDTNPQLLSHTYSICVSGTSASCLMVDANTGDVHRPPKMYDYDITQTKSSSPTAHIQVQDLIDIHAPPNHVVRGSTSALSKLLHYHYIKPFSQDHNQEIVLAHQSEYVATQIFRSNPKQCGAGPHANRRSYVSDWHNVLKLGYDVQKLEYPTWIYACLDEANISRNVLPQVVSPGQVISKISSNVSKLYGIPESAVVVGGTTDSNAAFFAAAAGGTSAGIPYGTAVTSLGSTLALKMWSRTFVQDSERGVYSHRVPIFGNQKTDSEHGMGEEAWLVGGASNVGCAILRQEQFSNDELSELSTNMDVSTDSPYKYYPLVKKGERFPVADGNKHPLLEPKPDSRQEYLKGILQGISQVEEKGWNVLGALGSDPPFPSIVWTAGGGSRNDAWLSMRERLLNRSKDGDNVGETKKVRVRRADNAEASFGAAILAASNFQST